MVSPIQDNVYDYGYPIKNKINEVPISLIKDKKINIEIKFNRLEKKRINSEYCFMFLIVCDS